MYQSRENFAEFDLLEGQSLKGSLILRIASLSGGICYVKCGKYVIGKIDDVNFQEIYDLPSLKDVIEIGFLSEKYSLSEEWESELLSLFDEFMRRSQILKKNKKRSNQRGKKKGS